MSRETFEALLNPNLRALHRLVHNRIRTPGDADDVIQEILLRAFVCRDQLRAEPKFRSWLWSIAMNSIREFFRHETAVVSIEDFACFDVRDRGLSPLAELERHETSEWVRACVSKLPKRERAAIRLRDIEGMSVRQAAAALNSSESAAKTAHFRAIRRLACVIRESAGLPARIPSRPAA